jgi:hypothetical protein
VDILFKTRPYLYRILIYPLKIRKVLHSFRRKFSPPNWNNLRSVHPVSRTFGLDRGTPIDRYYIEKFLKNESVHIKGIVLEVAESTYSKAFGHGVISYEVLHTQKNMGVTILGDLTTPLSLPANKIDCFICTQTFNFIYDVKSAIQGSFHLLKPGGVLLATMAGLSQISRYDMDRWGDYWRFTTLSAKKLFAEQYGEENVEVHSYGNVLSSIAFLEGIAAEELNKKELDHLDQDYQIILTVKAIKSLN